MARYELRISKSAQKELGKCSSILRERILLKILPLSDNPRPISSKKLFTSNNYRIRIGDYRVIYCIDEDRKIVTILDLGHRKDIYR